VPPHPVASAIPEVADIDFSEVAAASRAGRPWNSLTPITELLLELGSDPLRYAEEVVYPDEELRWRLFHLAVYGEMVSAFVLAGWHVLSTGPLLGSARAPTHVAHRDASLVDLWFEASGAWRHYANGLPLGYWLATAAARTGRGALTPDCLAVRREGEDVVSAIALETKYSLTDPSYVIRDGYLQSLGYAVELGRALQCPTRVITVAPTSMVEGMSVAQLLNATDQNPEIAIGLCDPWSVTAAVDRERA
jgi:hypothetical protein